MGELARSNAEPSNRQKGGKNYEHDKKERQQAERAILVLLAELGGKTFDDDDITYSGNKLIIPETMTLTDAVGFLKAKAKDQETVTTFTRKFNYRPWDGAYCMWNAFKRTFGAVVHNHSMVQSMFGKMEAPPQMITIPTGVHSSEQIPWGVMELPFLPGVKFETEMARSEFGPLFSIEATGAKKYKYEVEGVFTLVQEELERNSLYRGKAFDGQVQPSFVDLAAVNPERVIYSDEVMSQLEANVWAQLRYTELFEKSNIPLKRAVLIHGPYGCISGDALMNINRAAKGSVIKLSDLVRRFNGEDNHYPWDKNIPTYIQREQDGVIRLGLIQNAWQSGEKETFTVTTESGRTIRATSGHPFWTDRGWLRLDEIQPRVDRVHVRGEQGGSGRKEKVRYKNVSGLHNHPNCRVNHVVDVHRLVVEANMNGISQDEFVARIKNGMVDGLEFLDPEKIVHHIDENPFNNEIENLEVVENQAEHARKHSIKTMNNVLVAIKAETVVSVERYGVEMTYDIEVEDEPHNFLADGIVVHNTGKTLAATLTGQIAVENGWTFIKARPGRDDLATVMQTARLYQPAVVFYEDVDQIAAPVDGDHEGIARLLDDFDGVDAKGTRILCVLTTNHPERIHKGMARPGRLDAMIEINELDQRGVERLVRTRIAREKLEDEIDWTLLFEHSHGYKPAFVTEFADRALRYVIVRTDGHPENVKISTEDLVHAADGLRPQFDKMTDAKDTDERTPLSEALKHEIRGVVQEHRVDYDEGGLLVPAEG